jgi:ATP-dependent exoDNAse (exonuclease V) beta subunit
MQTQSELLREDAAARIAALDVERSFIVQAPAGSGKTELLTQRFLALLGVVERPESLLAITFTRKAAAEMRNRILEALRLCGDEGSALRPETRALARRTLEADRRRDWRLLENPGRLRVLTIDALNQSLARRLPVTSGLGAGLGIEEDGRALYELAAERLLGHLPAGEPKFAEAVGVLLEHLDNSVGKLVSLVRVMLARREAWLPVLPSSWAEYGDEGEARARLEAGRVAIVEAHLTALAEEFPPDLLHELTRYATGAARVLREAGNPESPILHCDGTVPGTRAADVLRWQGLAQFLLTEKGTARKRFTSSEGVLGQDRKRPEVAELKQRIVDATSTLEPLESLCEALAATRALPSAAYTGAEWHVLKSLLLVLRLAASELKVVFAERRCADYPEFAAAARQALGTEDEPTDTALALDARLQHILVDEFQDTSEAQVRLLEALTLGWQPDDGRTLFLVGDPMQSIYRFRNAEVGLFLDVRERGLGPIALTPLTLRVNFRSTRPVVEWINDCFERVLPQRDDIVGGGVKYAQSVPAPQAGAGGGVTLHPFLRSSRELEARTVADIVAGRLAELDAEGDAAREARIGILVQGRSHLLLIVEQLVARGIPFQATDIDPLDRRPAVLDALALTRALAHLADRAAWLAVLRAAWCGLTLADSLVLLGDDVDGAALRLLRDPVRRGRVDLPARERLERCLPVLETALEEVRRFGLRDAVERAWHALGGPATLDDARGLDEVQAYFDALGEVEADAPGAPVDFERLTRALEELYAKSSARPGVRVELLTIHKSKGLQFDTVIVPGLERVGGQDDPSLLSWLKLPGAGHGDLVIAPIAATGEAERNRLHAWLGRLEHRKLQQEKRRLLYVATTRAERRLHLLGSCRVAPDKKTGALQLQRPGGRTALGLLWVDPRVREAFERRLAEAGQIEGEPAPAVRREPLLRRLPASWQRPAAPDGPDIRVRVLPRARIETEVEFDWASETARHVGTVVHRELQQLARREASSPWETLPLAATVRGALADRYATELAELGVPEERRAAAVERVFEAVSRTLGDARGRWLLLHDAHREAETELALTGRLGSDVVSVVLDRTFVDADGTRWIVDYKTSAHEGTGLDEFLDNERERYRPQLERYAALLRPLGPEPIRLGLYFPLLGGWREWESG